MLESLRQTVPQVVRESEDALIALALEAEQKLVAGMPVDAALVAATVREALGQIEDTAGVTVTLHPDDLALLKPGDYGAGLEFRSSPEITRGGCLVHTRIGIVDARLETRIEKLKEAVQG